MGGRLIFGGAYIRRFTVYREREFTAFTRLFAPAILNLAAILPRSLANTYKQTSTVIYDRLSVITDGNKSVLSSYFESCLR